MVGVRDWSFVSFDDYKHDMDEQRQTSVAILKKIRHENTTLKRAIGVIVLAAGGTVRVPHSMLGDAAIGLVVSEDQANDCRIFVATPIDASEGEAER